MSSKQFKTTQNDKDNQETSSKRVVSKREKERKEKELASLIAFVIFFGGLILGVGVYSVNYYNSYLEEQMIASVEDGYIYLPNHQFITADDAESTLDNILLENTYPLEYKLEVLEYLHKQDYTKVDDYIKKVNELHGTTFVIDDKTNVVLDMTNNNLSSINGNLATTQQVVDTVDFLKSEGVLNEDFELEDSTNTDSGMTGINTKKAVSYRNLNEAEVAYGTKLGLYMYVDALENYEMINAYIIDDSFLQCVYAINQDGTKIKEEDIQNPDKIRTLTVKMSTLETSENLRSVYKTYPTLKSEQSDFGTIQYCGNELDLVNLIYVDRSDKRSYVIHSADGIDMLTAQKLVRELYGNLELINAGE